MVQERRFSFLLLLLLIIIIVFSMTCRRPTGSADVTFFHFLFNGPRGDQLSQNVLDRSSSNVQDKHTQDQSDLLFTIAGWTLL